MIKSLLATFLTLILLDFLPPVEFLNWITVALATVILTLLFELVRPILKVLLLPFNVITFGLFSSLLTTGLFWLALYLIPGFSISPMLFFGVRLNQFMSVVFVSVLFTSLRQLIRKILR